VRIIRDQHPFEGQDLAVFGHSHRRGQLHLTLILPDGSKSLIPAEWTDLYSIENSRQSSTAMATVEDLLRCRVVVDALQRRLVGSDRETASLDMESAHANPTEFYGGASSIREVGVGPVRRRAKGRSR
jgi:hypothetical protein